MKNVTKLKAIQMMAGSIVIAAVIVFSFASCKDPADSQYSHEPGSTYMWNDGTDSYMLIISESRAVTSGSFVLNITDIATGVSKPSITGEASGSSNSITLTVSGSSVTLNITTNTADGTINVTVTSPEKTLGGFTISGGKGTITDGFGKIIVLEMPVTYDPYISNMSGAKAAANFSYFCSEIVGYVVTSAKTFPINEEINGASVIVNAGKVTISLGKPIFLNAYFSFFFFDYDKQSNIKVTPSNADYYCHFPFFTKDGKYAIVCENGNDYTLLVYADRDVTLTGTHIPDPANTYNVNASLKTGWNYLIFDTSVLTVTASTTQPAGFGWTVFDGGIIADQKYHH